MGNKTKSVRKKHRPMTLQERWAQEEERNEWGWMAYNTPEEKKKADEEFDRINHMIYGDNIPKWLKNDSNDKTNE